MKLKIFCLVSVFVLSAMLVLTLGYLQAQTPGQVPVFSQPLTGMCNSAGGNDCIDSVITQDAIGNIGIGTTTLDSSLDSPLSVAGGALINQGDDANIPDTGVTFDALRGQTLRFGRGNVAFPSGEAIFSNRLPGSPNQFGLSFMTNYRTNMVVANNGNIGIGTTTPDRAVTVLRSGAATESFQNLKNSNHELLFGVDAAAVVSAMTASDLQLRTNNANRVVIKAGTGDVGIGTTTPGFKLDVAGAAHATSFPTSSDMRLKKDVRPLNGVLEKIEKIRGVTFHWNERYEALGRSTGRREIGVIAQEVEAVFPELVTTWGDESYRAVDYGRLTGVLIEAIKEQQGQIRDLRAQNSDLKVDNAELKARFEALERLVKGTQTAWSEAKQ